MELLKLKLAYCSCEDRNDLSCTLTNLVAVITPTFPTDTVFLGKVLPSGTVYGADSSATWWLLGYSLKFHMVFAHIVSGKHPAHIMSLKTVLRTVNGAVSTFETAEWRACVTTDKLFYDLGADCLNDEAIVASFITMPPVRFNLELSYSLFNVNRGGGGLLPYVTEWVELSIAAGVAFIEVPEGVKHLSITSSLSETLLRLPDSLVSCYIHKDISVKLSISKRFAKNWCYWSAVWGKSYTIKAGFTRTPDGLVSVRP